MRALLLRSSMVMVGLTLAVVLVPILTAVIILVCRSPQERVAATASSAQLAVGAVVAGLVITGLAVWLGVTMARRQAQWLTRPLTQLAAQAERLGAGESTVEPLHTGITEIDRISEVLAASGQDITRVLAAERDFAADASHQLRTPLAALLLRLEEIASTDDPVVVRHEATNAIAQVERLAGVVDDIRARGRGQQQPQETVALDSVLAALQREWQPAFARARRSMHVHGQRGLLVRIRRAALSEILATLIENSLAHGIGTVSVEARRSGPSVVVEITDQGPGVPADIAPHVFERSVSSSGTGLGLALARDLAENNHGRLELVRAEPAVFALFLSSGDSAPAKTNLR